MSAYAIADEPAPGRLAAYVVNPSLPQLAAFLGGSWIGLPWLVFNAYALGSVDRRREATLAALSPVLSVALAFVFDRAIGALHLGTPAALAGLAEVLGLPGRAYAYTAVLGIALKMAFVYVIHRSQEKSFGIYEYTGGRGRNALALVLVAAALRKTVVMWAFGVSYWLGWVVA